MYRLASLQKFNRLYAVLLGLFFAWRLALRGPIPLANDWELRVFVAVSLFCLFGSVLYLMQRYFLAPAALAGWLYPFAASLTVALFAAGYLVKTLTEGLRPYQNIADRYPTGELSVVVYAAVALTGAALLGYSLRSLHARRDFLPPGNPVLPRSLRHRLALNSVRLGLALAGLLLLAFLRYADSERVYALAAGFGVFTFGSIATLGYRFAYWIFDAPGAYVRKSMVLSGLHFYLLGLGLFFADERHLAHGFQVPIDQFPWWPLYGLGYGIPLALALIPTLGLAMGVHSCFLVRRAYGSEKGASQ